MMERQNFTARDALQRSGGLVETGETASTLPLASKTSLVESDTADERYEL